MAERSAEVLVCGASIMKDVWEIRLRDYRQKIKREDERIQRSALQTINQDWHARMSYKIKTKRLERKAKPPEESSLQTHKVKQMNVSRTQGFHSRRLQRQADSMKTTKVNKLALVCRINESCPGLMVWAKSWKFSKPLPQTEESSETCCVSDWGKSWKFLTIQSNINGKSWFDVGFDTNNNMSSNDILFLWERLGKALETQHLHQDVSTPEWEKCWVFKQKREDDTSSGPKNKDSNKLYNLLESHHQNQEDSEWNNSWKSTKPSNDVRVRSDLIQPTRKEEDQNNEEEQSKLSWNTSWMYCKKQLNMKCRTSNHSGWSQSWRVSKTIAEQEKKSVCSEAVISEEPLHFNFLNVIMNLSTEMKHTIQRSSQFHGGDIQSPEWEKSWVTIKNLSEYKEETNKQESTEKPIKNQMEEPKMVGVKIETPQTECQHVTFVIPALPKRQKCHEVKNFLRQNERETHVLNWTDSWKMLKLQRKEQRSLWNHRRPPLQTSLSEWADSRKFTNLTLNQDSSLWQQEWFTIIQPRRNRRERDMLNEDFSYYGPTGVRGWGESWRSTRHQYNIKRQDAGAPTQPINPQANTRSVTDWEQSWQSSSDQHHHDRASMTEWMSSWRFSSDNLGEVQSINTWTHSKEINGNSQHSCMIKKRSDGTAYNIIRREILDWDTSWMFTSKHFYQRQGDYYLKCKLSSDARNHAMPSAVQIEIKSEWGRSWKISNPQPPKNIAFWMDAKPRSFCAQDVPLWTRDKHNSYLLSALHKQPDKLKTWGASWSFLKMESNQGFNSPTDETVINSNTKIKKHKNSNIDKHKPQLNRWNGACKIAKTQSRPKLDISHKFGNDECEDGKKMFAEWTESWKFSNGLKRCEEMSISLNDWKKSWKFLLDPYVPLNGPQTIKGR